MNRSLRFAALALLALLLPLRGLAAACLQIEMAVADAGVPSHGHGHDEPAPAAQLVHHHHEECDGAELGAAKCCQAHPFAAESPLAAPFFKPASFEPARLVARWTSFFPEEPSPPPIGAFAPA